MSGSPTVPGLPSQPARRPRRTGRGQDLQVPRPPRLEPVVQAICLTTLVLMLAGFALSEGLMIEFAAVAGIALVAAVSYRTLLQWPVLLGFLVLLILFLPIRRYTVSGGLPFELEPYRMFMAFVIAGWTASLLVDPRVRFRRSGCEAAIALIVVAAFGSLATNPGRVAVYQAEAVKQLTFLISFLLLFYLIVSVVRGRRDVDRIVKVLCGGGVILAIFAMIEARSGYNVFDHLDGALPFIQYNGVEQIDIRAGRARVYGSAQHPIALGAMFVMLVPLSIYLARRKAIWFGAVGLFVITAITTLSRTAILMLVIGLIVFLVMRPVETRRLWPLLIPVLVLTHFAAPGALGSLKETFLPEGGIINEQRADHGGTLGSGRVTDLGPSLAEASRRPLFGYGLGTRSIEPGKANAVTLDNQWLSSLLETGIVGILGWGWLFLRVFRRLCRVARRDDSDAGWLFLGLAAAILGFFFSMFTLDSFAFIQLTVIQIIILALGCALLRERAREEAVGGGPGPDAARAGRAEPPAGAGRLLGPRPIE